MTIKTTFTNRIAKHGRPIILVLSLLLSIAFLSGFSLDVETEVTGPLTLPANSSDCSYETALELLSVCSGHYQENSYNLMDQLGFDVIIQNNFDKEDSDPSHSSAYTIGIGNAYIDDKPCNAILITIRGTNAGEWYANFDFCPSHSDEAEFSEDALLSAQEIFLNSREIIDSNIQNNPDTRIIVAGHSRGASSANMLGMLLDEVYSNENIYVYTYATPSTIHGTIEGDYSNIFNFINPSDMIPQLPLSSWGFSRAGIDIELPINDEAKYKRSSDYIDTLSGITDSISSYYNDRHSLTQAGLDENGLSSYDLLIIFSDMLVDISTNSSTTVGAYFNARKITKQLNNSSISEESDFYPLLTMMQEMMADDYAIAIEILNEHLPNTYAELISQLMNQSTNK